MKRFLTPQKAYQTLIYALTALMLILILASIPQRAEASIATWQRGGTMIPRSTTDLASEKSKQSMDRLVAMNANYVTFIIPLRQTNGVSTDVKRGFDTPTDETLIEAIRYAHSIGLKVMLKFHAETHYDDWRATINPENREAWFTSYGALLHHFAEIAEAHDVEDLCLGAELISMTSPVVNPTNTDHWRMLIADIRNVYTGQLTYSANRFNEIEVIEFWDDLDFVGVSPYFDAPESDGSVDSLVQEWQKPVEQYITPVLERFNKPLLITEIGYRSLEDAHMQPWNWQRQGPYDAEAQSNLYEALFRFWKDSPSMRGIHIWDWHLDPAAGGPGNIDYTPQNKPAEALIRTWFGNTDTSTSTAPTKTIVSNTSFSPRPPLAGKEMTVTAHITMASTTVHNAQVILEIHDLSDQKIAEKIITGQTLNADATHTFSAPFTLTEGYYSIVIGIFGNNGATRDFWNKNAGTFIVQKESPPPPSGTSVRIGIQNPKHNSTVNGIVPLRASMPYIAITKYNLFWQVDGGELIPSYNSYEGYAHKEAMIDVSQWTWSGNGPYQLRLVAKNNAGQKLSEQTIYVRTSN